MAKIPRTKIVLSRLTKEEKAEVDTIVDTMGVSISDFVRELILNHIEVNKNIKQEV